MSAKKETQPDLTQIFCQIEKSYHILSLVLKNNLETMAAMTSFLGETRDMVEEVSLHQENTNLKLEHLILKSKKEKPQQANKTISILREERDGGDTPLDVA